jgi:hypothetical protein
MSAAVPTEGTDSTGQNADDGRGQSERGRDRLSDESQGYVQRAIENAAPSHIPGALSYYRNVARAAARGLHPAAYPTPSIGDSVVGTFFSSTEQAQSMALRSLGPLANPRTGGALDDLAQAHPNSDLLRPTMTVSSRAISRVTTVEVEVDQNARGDIVAFRVLHRSGVSGFDRAAEEALRGAVRQIDHPNIVGLWRSRWAMEITASRDPIITATPGTAGSPPGFGLAIEVESDGEDGPVFHSPGQLHIRRRVRVLSSRVVDNGASVSREAQPGSNH